MKVYFRVDASIHIGSGHVMRCLSLANQLHKSGYDIVFVIRPQNGDLSAYIAELGFKVIKLNRLNTFTSPRSTDDYKSWLQVTEIQDAKEFLSIALDAEIVVVDHYGINLAWEEFVKSSIACKLVVIDDLVRQHNADLIIDQTYGVDPNEYLSHSAVKYVLTGSEYALLNTQFSVFHKLAVEERKAKNTHKLMISMGGVDKPNATLKVLEALSMRETKFDTTVLLSERAPHFHSVSSFCKGNEDWVRHITFSENMAELMLKHTIAIGAPGSTSWERTCIGLPSILIPLAENQKKICDTLVSEKAVLSLSLNEISKKLKTKLDELLLNFEDMRKKNLEICDGLGTKRVVTAIRCLNVGEVTLKKATAENIRQVYDWQSLPQTRRYANDTRVPTWSDHKAWMQEKLKSDSDFFYIINFDDNEVGVIRLDQTCPKRYLISIYISPIYFGKGIAKKALSVIDILHPNIEIIAEVLEANIASQTLFKAAGYKREKNNLFIRGRFENYDD